MGPSLPKISWSGGGLRRLFLSSEARLALLLAEPEAVPSLFALFFGVLDVAASFDLSARPQFWLENFAIKQFATY